MTINNSKLTQQEAKALFSSNSGANFPNTEHNRNMMKQQVDNLIASLIAEREAKNA